jgi:sec-independent protein translocase protein TatA
MFGLSIREIIIIVLVLVILFGSKKIPELANSISEAVRILRKSFKKTEEDKKK